MITLDVAGNAPSGRGKWGAGTNSSKYNLVIGGGWCGWCRSLDVACD
jgi:hypothetical protein